MFKKISTLFLALLALTVLAGPTWAQEEQAPAADVQVQMPEKVDVQVPEVDVQVPEVNLPTQVEMPDISVDSPAAPAPATDVELNVQEPDRGGNALILWTLGILALVLLAVGIGMSFNRAPSRETY